VPICDSRRSLRLAATELPVTPIVAYAPRPAQGGGAR